MNRRSTDVPTVAETVVHRRTSRRLSSLGSGLVGGPPPRQAPTLVGVLVLLTAALSHLPGLTAAAIGTGLLAAVLAPLWLPTAGWVSTGFALAVLTVPFPPEPAAAGAAAAVLGCALAGGRLLTLLAAEVQQAHSAVLRQGSVHEEAAREAMARHEELTSRLRYATTHDGLTGLLDRATFLDQLGGQITTGSPTGVVVVTLAGFAEVNETLGPDVGDQVLAALGRRLQGAARDSDVVARLGGDVFAVLLPGLSGEHALPVGTRLHKVFEDPVTVGPHTVPLRSRAGIACAEAGELTSAELVRRAELTARSAMPGGPVVAWDVEAEAHGASRIELEADMHRGLLADEFFLLYQPLVSTRTGTITNVEALVRWQHPTRGLVPPDQFIGLAESSGLIVPLGLKVLEMACAQLREWTSLGTGANLTMAVNVSTRQLLEPDFVPKVRQILWSSAIDPRQVVLELTESMLVDDSDAAVAVLWQLRALGVRLAIDDFGTGYSSLARLGEMPVDELKIDKSFVDRLGANPHDSTALVTAAVAMGHGLALEVVAEGVETAAQAALLQSVGCDLLQGYLLGKPQRPADITPQLGTRLLADMSTIPGPRTSVDEAPAAAPVPAPSPEMTIPSVMPL